MQRVLVTGATGNIGREVVHFLLQKEGMEVISAVRNVEKARSEFPVHPSLSFRKFDFQKTPSEAVFDGVDVLFLLRPPQLADVDKYFVPLLRTAKKKLSKVVFLSVQGAEKSKTIPHHKIEHAIRELGFEYIFVRPSYFMQNLTTTLAKEIREERRITLPSGKGKFNWIDVKDIGEATASLICRFDEYRNKAIEITGEENLSFGEVTDLMSQVYGQPFRFRSVNPIRFFFMKRREGMPSDFAFVMTMLHFIPRLVDAPKISPAFEQLLGKRPSSLKTFLERERKVIVG